MKHKIFKFVFLKILLPILAIIDKLLSSITEAKYIPILETDNDDSGIVSFIICENIIIESKTATSVNFQLSFNFN